MLVRDPFKLCGLRGAQKDVSVRQAGDTEGRHRHPTSGLLRVAVIGTSASGKTTFAAHLAHALNSVHVELDQLHWLPGWETRPLDEFRELVRQVTAGERWVIDGNYGKVRGVIWPRATHLVWLNYSFPIVFWRALRRTYQRVSTGEELFSGNRETWRSVIFDRDSIPWWVLRTYRRRRREYPQLFKLPAHKHLQVIELRSPNESHEWLQEISRPERE
jgi:adenylate kinase family enzyme